MFRPMRRKDKQLPESEVLELLANGEEGVLATVGEDGYPYATPLNYVYHNGGIYFHCALSGHKIDNMAFNPKVSFCVTADTEILAKDFSTKFRSAVVFGRAEEVRGDEKAEGLRALIQRLTPDYAAAGEKYIKNAWDKTRVYKINIEHMSGKIARD